MSKVYVIIGQTGQYDDYREWNVIAFKHKTKANNYLKLVQDKADEIYEKQRNRYSFNERDNEYDPRMSMDYNGTKYTIEELKLEE